jgi:hypothetical protein
MTLPLKRDRDKDEPTAEMAPGSRSTQESEEQLKQEGPRLVRSESLNDAGDMNAPKTQGDGDAAPLLVEKDRQELQSRWDQIQTGFVDQPRNAVHDADELVSSAIERLSQVFATERSRLEQQWDRGDSVSTEDLRVTLQRYRSFFQRVLSV